MSTFVSPAEGRVTSHWGPRERHPVTGVRGFHRGIDIAPPRPGQRGVPVYACYGGTVRAVRTGKRNGDRDPNPITGTWNTGNYVLIDGPGGGSEWYGHLETIRVAPGDKVSAGDLLGTMGDSGNVTGVHLHLEMWNSRTSGGGIAAGNTRDPRLDFRAAGVEPESAPRLVKNATTLPTPSKTLTSLPQEDDMPLTDADVERIRVAILGDRHPNRPGDDMRGLQVVTANAVEKIPSAADNALAVLGYKGKDETRDVYSYLRTTQREVLSLQAQTAGLSKALEQLAISRGVDPKQITDAISTAVDAALSRIRLVTTED